MSVAPWVQRHSRSIILLVIVLVTGGVVSALRLPVALFPQVSFPRVRISLDAGDRPAERMGIEVTYPVEEALRAVPGVRGIRSTTSRGSAEIDIDFDWGHDMVSAAVQVESQVNKMLPTLPTGTSFDVRRMDPTVFPAIAYSLTSDTRSLVELKDLATYELRPPLTAVTGVSRVGIQGGATEEYRVVVDPAKLQAFRLTLADISAKLSASNILSAVGRIDDHHKLYLVVSDTRFKNIEQLKAVVLKSGTNGVVRLEDVAMVRDESAPEYIRVTADGHDAVLLLVYQQPDANTVQIAKDVKTTLAEIQKRLPSGVRIANWYDQSDLIVASASSARDAVLIGAGLAMLVLLVFLRNLRITFVAAVTVPATLAATMLLMGALGMSFNIMTLGGMAAAVGLIIDDAIVMVEQVMRRLPDAGDDRRGGVLRAAAEFTRPLVGSSASTVIIFVPLAFLSGVTGAFFKALSLTMAISLILSFLIAWLAVPIVSAAFVRQADARRELARKPGPVSAAYGWIMAWLLRYPWAVSLIVVPLLVCGYFAFQHVGSGFMPSMDEGGFILDYNAPSGTSLGETDRMLRKVEQILQHTPGVQTYSRRTGLQLGGGITEANQGDFFIRLKPQPRAAIDEIMEDVRKQVEHTTPGLKIETAQLMEDLIGDLTGVPQPIEIKLFSDDENALSESAPKVADAISKVTGVEEVKNGIVVAGDAMEIEVDRAKAAMEGVDADTVTKLLNDALTGSVTTQILHGPKLIGVRVWLPRSFRATQESVNALQLRAADGHSFPVSRIATSRTVSGQPEINRENLKRMVAVTGRISGRDLGSTIAEITKVLQQPGLIPHDVSYQLGGLYQQQRTAFRGLLVVIVAATVLVFLLLLYLYERFRIAVVLLVTTLLSIAAVFIGLWCTRTELNITSIMGMTMIVGIVTEVGIFYYSEFVELSGEGSRNRRLIVAGQRRHRAIAMTTLAAILALFPLALGIGEGSAMQRPLAIAIISGLVIQVPLVLVVLPALIVLSRAIPPSHETTNIGIAVESAVALESPQ